MCRAQGYLGFMLLLGSPYQWLVQKCESSTPLLWIGTNGEVYFPCQSSLQDPAEALGLLEINLCSESSPFLLSSTSPHSPPDAPGSTSLINRLHTNC